MRVPWYLMAKGKGGGGHKTASGPIVSVNDALAAPLRALTLSIDPVQAGTGDPSPDNVRPISGWNEVNLWRTGKNLIDLSFLEFDDSTYSHAYYPATTSQVTDYAKLMERFIGKTIVLSASITGTQSAGTQPIGTIRLVNSGGDTFQIRSDTPATVPDMDYSNVSYLVIYGSANGASVSDIQLELGSTPTPYTPYTGTTATIQLGQTVYGGTLDVKNGVLTVDRAMVMFDGSNDEAWHDYSNYNGYYIQLNAMKSGNRQDGWSNMLKDSKTSAQGQIGAMWLGVNNSKNFFVIGVHDTMGATLSVFRSYLSEHPLELVYPLATPITIPLTPQEISTLAGQNVVWADCGDVTVEYLSAGGANPDLMKLAVAFMGRK